MVVYLDLNHFQYLGYLDNPVWHEVKACFPIGNLSYQSAVWDVFFFTLKCEVCCVVH